MKDKYKCECAKCLIPMTRQASYDKRDIWKCYGCGNRSIVVRE